MDNLKSIIAVNIKRLLREKRLSQKDVADALGVKQQSVSRWVNGLSEPEPENMDKLAELFGVPFERLTENAELAEKAGSKGTDHDAIKQAVAEALAADPRLRLMDQQLEKLLAFHDELGISNGGKTLGDKIETIYELCREVLDYKQTVGDGIFNVRLAGSIEGAGDWKELAKMGKLDESQKAVCDLIFNELTKPIELSAEQIKAFCEIYDAEKNGRRREDVLRALHDHLVHTGGQVENGSA